MRGTFPRQVGLLDLVTEIEEAALALPEFQRDFEWQDLQVEALLTTLLKGWPSGSLLFLEASQSLFFKPREFKGGPLVDPLSTRTIVLDGQQRLTSVFHAVTGSGDAVYAYALPLEGPVKTSVDDVEDSLGSFSHGQWAKMTRADGLVINEGNLYVPFTTLRSITRYYDWRDDAIAKLSRMYPDISQRLRTAYSELFENLQAYSFPVIFVDSAVQPEAVARIFERVNRNSEPLSTFDLLVARTFKEGWNMRELWAEARLERPSLDRFYGGDGTVVVETLSLASGKPSVRKSDILNLDADYVRANWADAVQAVAACIERLAETCGCTDPKHLPYGVLVPLYAGLSLRRPNRFVKDEDLRRHFFLSSFGLRFDVAANTRVVEEWRILQDVSRPLETTLQELARRRPISRALLVEATRQSHGAIWRGLVCLLAVRLQSGYKDFVPVSLLKRVKGKDWHLRAAGTVLGSPEQAAIATRGDLWDLERKAASLDAERQLLPDLAVVVGPDELIELRAQLVLEHLRSTFDAVIEAESTDGSA